MQSTETENSVQYRDRQIPCLGVGDRRLTVAHALRVESAELLHQQLAGELTPVVAAQRSTPLCFVERVAFVELLPYPRVQSSNEREVHRTASVIRGSDALFGSLAAIATAARCVRLARSTANAVAARTSGDRRNRAVPPPLCSAAALRRSSGSTATTAMPVAAVTSALV